MKKISTILMMTLIILSSFAFTKALKQSCKIVQTFYYSGSGSVDDPANYQTSMPSGVSCGGSSAVVCSIQAEANSNGTQPVFDAGYTVSANPAHYSTTKRR